MSQAYPVSWGVLAMNRKISFLLIAAAGYFLVFSAIKYNLSVTTNSESVLPALVIVDAGHGGEDGGASTAQGIPESEINLQISLRLEQMLALSGIEPFMIRSADVSVYTGDCDTLSEKKVSDLKKRVATVNGIPNALLVSIHQNHFSQSGTCGAQVFFAKTEGSRDLAAVVQDSLQMLAPDNHRKIKPAESVYLMNHIQCTGILVECGFLSNPRESMLLQQQDYQKKMTAAICGAVSRYMEGTLKDEV